MKGHRGRTEQPTMMIHHVREIQTRLLAIAIVLITGMVVGYVFYEPLFEFIKAPLNAPLHYMSPAGSFTFIIKICLLVGVIVALPIAVYNGIMFVRPALAERLSKPRVYLTTIASLLLAGAGAAFGFLVIIPLALRFFYKFQVDGLVAIISADEYLRFVVSVIITFVVIFQLPLIISLIDHITPLPPKKLLKLEKYIIVGSVFIGVIVPFALDPTVQLLIASPIIVLYNLSIIIVAIQHAVRRRRSRRKAKEMVSRQEEGVSPVSRQPVPVLPQRSTVMAESLAEAKATPPLVKSLDGTLGRPSASKNYSATIRPQRAARPLPPIPSRPRRVIADVRPRRARFVSSSRPLPSLAREQAAE